MGMEALRSHDLLGLDEGIESHTNTFGSQDLSFN
jgi:hypothetical protein